MANLILLAIILGPVVLLTILRVNATLVYLSLCLGYVLSQFVGNNLNINNLISSSKVTAHFSTATDVRIGLLLLPALLATIFMIKTTKGGKFSFDLLPALATGLLLVYLLVPQLPFSATTSIAVSKIWIDLRRYQADVIGISSAFVLALMLIQRPKPIGHHKHGKIK